MLKGRKKGILDLPSDPECNSFFPDLFYILPTCFVWLTIQEFLRKPAHKQTSKDENITPLTEGIA